MTLTPKVSLGFAARIAASAAGSPPHDSFPSLIRTMPPKASFLASSLPATFNDSAMGVMPLVFSSLMYRLRKLFPAASSSLSGRTILMS